MANPEGRVIMEEAEAQQAAERYARIEAELQALRQRNEEIMRDLQEAQNAAATEHVRADQRSRAQTQEFVNLTAELLAGRQGHKYSSKGCNSVSRFKNLQIMMATKARTLILGYFWCMSIWI